MDVQIGDHGFDIESIVEDGLIFAPKVPQTLADDLWDAYMEFCPEEVTPTSAAAFLWGFVSGRLYCDRQWLEPEFYRTENRKG